MSDRPDQPEATAEVVSAVSETRSLPLPSELPVLPLKMGRHFGGGEHRGVAERLLHRLQVSTRSGLSKLLYQVTS